MPKLSDFHAPEPKRVVLPNGMIIFLQEDHELPLIDGVCAHRGGSRSWSLQAKSASPTCTEKSGAPAEPRRRPAINSTIFSRPVPPKLKPAVVHSTTIDCSSLKGDLDDVFKVFVDVLQNPEFRPDKLELAQKEAVDAISRRNDQVGEIAVAILRLAYGPNNPYAPHPEYSTISAVTHQDLIDWHATYVHPNNIILGIVGDFDSAAMEATARGLESGPKARRPKE